MPTSNQPSIRLLTRRLLSSSFVIWVCLGSTNSWADTLTVTINNVQKLTGSLMVAVMDSEAAYKDEEPAVASVILPAAANTITFNTDALAAGSYGIRVMHDENGNQELDANMLGIPKEPYGFSNNAAGKFGPPKWADLLFELSGDTAVSIDLN